MTTPPDPPSPRGETRRRFGARVAALLGVPLGLVAGIPGLASLLDPLRRAGSAPWRPTGQEAARVGAEPVRVTWEVEAAWETRRRVGWVRREDDALVAFDARCTHAGCLVRPGAAGFDCPCHGGRFGPGGEPVAGPVTRPLERLAVRERAGRIEVREGDA